MIALTLSFELSPSLDLVSLSLSQSHNSFSFFPCLILVKILPQSLVFLTFFETPMRKQILLAIASLHTHLVPLELKLSLIDSFCLHEPSKVNCNLYPPVSWLSLHCGPMHS